MLPMEKFIGRFVRIWLRLRIIVLSWILQLVIVGLVVLVLDCLLRILSLGRLCMIGSRILLILLPEPSMIGRFIGSILKKVRLVNPPW